MTTQSLKRKTKNRWKTSPVILVAVCIFILFGSYGYGETKLLTLDDSLTMALKNSPLIIAAREKQKATSAKLGQAVSLAIPHLSLDGSYGRNYQQPVATTVSIPGLPPMQISSSPDEAAKVSSYSATIKQNVFLGGKMLLAIEAADAGDKMAREDYKKAEAELTFNVIQSYYNVLKAHKILAVTEEVLANLKKYARQINIFYNAGLSTKADVLRVETEAANLQAAAIQARAGLKIAQFSLNSLLGKDLSENTALAQAVLTEKETKTFSLNDLLKITYDNRPEWKSFLYGKKITGSAVGYAYSGYLPNIVLAGSIGKSITEYPSAEKKYDLNSWRVILAGSWNIFDGLETPYKVAEAESNFSAIKAQEQIVKDGLALEVTAALMSWEASQESLTASQLAADLARKAFRFAEINFNAHIGTNLALLDAQTALHRAETNLYSAQFDGEIARAKINKSVGKNIF